MDRLWGGLLWYRPRLMRGLERAKREMLREALADNLATIEGTWLPSLKAPRRGVRALMAGIVALALPTIVLGAIWLANPVAVPSAEIADTGTPEADASEPLNSRAAEREQRFSGPKPLVAPPFFVPSQEMMAAVPVEVGPAMHTDEGTLVFPPPAPLDRAVFPLPVRTVILDPGHGGTNNPGTVASIGVMEKEITLDIARRLKGFLERAGFRVVLTRDDDREVQLEERTTLANSAQGDIFVSIHVNWIEGSARGIETFYLGPTDDPYLSRLTQRENRDSGYSLAALREILDGVYANVRQDESRRLATAVHDALRSHVAEVTPSLVDRGVKTAPFLVLVGTEMPAILAEVSALSNEQEAALLELPAYREYIALALYSGIRGYADGLDRPESPDRTAMLDGAELGG